LGSGMKPNRPVCVNQKYCSGDVTSPKDNGTIPVSAFRHPVYGDTLESFIGRNSFRADGTQQVDAGIYKTFKVVGATSLMLRLDCFNMFNQVRWWLPNNDINAPATFGNVTQTAYGATNSGGSAPTPLTPPRTFQIGFRLIY